MLKQNRFIKRYYSSIQQTLLTSIKLKILLPPSIQTLFSCDLIYVKHFIIIYFL